MGIYPGQVLRFPELRLAERALMKLGIFEMDPEKGSKPTITPVPTSDPNVQDILVVVKETHTGSFQIGAGYNTDNGLVGTIVLQERNFDITRWPTSWNDFLEGKAFRGANQDFRIEAVSVSTLLRFSVTWPYTSIFVPPYPITYRRYLTSQHL